MGMFKKSKATNTFKQLVTVIMPDDSEGDLQVTYERVSFQELNDLIEEGGDMGLCRRVVKDVGTIEIEDSDEKLTGAAALEEVLTDSCAVAALTSTYIEVMKTRNFRSGKPAKRR